MKVNNFGFNKSMTFKQSDKVFKFGKIELESPSDSLTEDEKSESDMFQSDQD